jgi:dihydroxy-acid dehydratase
MYRQAAAGGPIALIEEGDIIEIDIPARSLHLSVVEEELARRRECFIPLKKKAGKVLKRYSLLVDSADRGATLTD